MGFKAESEATFQDRVVALAKVHNWKCFHVLRSDGMTAGWPDWVFLKAGRMVIAELKAADGKESPAQTETLDLLETVEARVAAALDGVAQQKLPVQVYLWRAGSEGHWRQIQTVLMTA